MLTDFLYEPVGKLHQLNQLVQAGRAAGERVFEILDEAERSRECDTEIRASACAATSSYDDVSFSYSENLPALSHISFHARPGETIALVGTTGAGKSTLVNLLTRFYEFDTGEILIDGKPIRDLRHARASRNGSGW